MEFRSLAFELKSVDAEAGTFEGYASVFGNVDSYRDVIDHGAFKKTLAEFSHRVKILWNHDPMMPIGRPVEMTEDDRGLRVKGRISETSTGKDVLILLRDGVINELSIGYTPIKDSWDRDNGIRHLTEVKLWEFSPVTWAANDLATITGVKGAGEGDLPTLLAKARGLAEEVKAGRVLSAANVTLVEGTIEALKNANEMLVSLLAAAEKGAGEPAHTGGDPDAQGVQSVLKALDDLRLAMKGA